MRQAGRQFIDRDRPGIDNLLINQEIQTFGIDRSLQPIIDR